MRLIPIPNECMHAPQTDCAHRNESMNSIEKESNSAIALCYGSNFTQGHCILAEGAMTLPVTLSGGVLFAS